ncbi:inositol monophosphatase family protein [Actibacterium pelagium]|uniref:Histidinol phosphate phosphatase n=1 Tax=Actibacterium pelagium TaxID=2029103 RepID=A0A917ACZ6_9RHOB|nr:inositol monophosphatase family protein [Actibacterium pelagium]GGE43212.1 histidinol phosphate phosphatase [Actibacterium pelagium]
MSTHTRQERLRAAVDITEIAARTSMRHFRRVSGFDTKSDESPVTIADRETEGRIRDLLEERFPEDHIFGEEMGRSGSSDRTWIIDPIDGTRSFIAGLPLFGMLLGFQDPSDSPVGVIRMPALGEVYAGAPGLGATRNEEPIHVSQCKHLSEAKLFINEGDKLAVQEPDVFKRLVGAGQLRRMGADCYAHALVAAGSIDAVVDFDLQPYDYLPVAAVVEAAGGVMTDWSGAPLTLNSDGRTLTASTPELHAELMALVAT